MAKFSIVDFDYTEFEVPTLEAALAASLFSNGELMVKVSEVDWDEVAQLVASVENPDSLINRYSPTVKRCGHFTFECSYSWGYQLWERGEQTQGGAFRASVFKDLGDIYFMDGPTDSFVYIWPVNGESLPLGTNGKDKVYIR